MALLKALCWALIFIIRLNLNEYFLLNIATNGQAYSTSNNYLQQIISYSAQHN